MQQLVAVQAPWSDRRRRARVLLDRHSYAAEVLRLYAALIDVQERVYERALASGKPALVQETGFSRHIPAVRGVVAFRTLDEAVRGAESIAADYAAHCRAAREIAEQYFDSDKVLGRLLEECS